MYMCSLQIVVISFVLNKSSKLC